MRDPIAQLLEEHRAIMAQIEPLRRAVRDLEARGDAAIQGSLAALEAVGRMMATELLAHARREDEALFPALESVFGGGGPTAVMRQEHRDIHAQAERFRATLRELEEVEHPAIVASGAKLRTMAARGASASDLRATSLEVIRLLDLHFAKEEDILFPMARQLLSDEALAEVARKFESLVTV
jgi:hemerythrin-like domain-containing protein